VDPDGPACWCGRRGCLECYASTSAVVDAWGDASDAESPPVLDDLLEAVAAGDAQARLAVEQAGARVGAVLGAVCNAINPDDIVIGGDLVAAGAPLIDAITQALHAHSLPETSRGLHIRTARLGDDDGALGAIALALGEPEAARISPLHAARTDH
ncbi:MAG: ROK family protein, partial [Micromonosporaceae bacterium]